MRRPRSSPRSAQFQLLQQQIATAKAQLLGNPDLPLERIPALRAGQGGARPGPAQSRPHRDARADGRHRHPGRADPARPLRDGRRAGVLSVIDTSNPWVDANPKESDFTYVAVGQSVTLEVDAFPNHVFKGTVGSLSPGTGAQFAILPPQNASGNFVKVVQRVPVRIYFDKNDKFVRKLKAGMSVYATIDTNHRRSLAGPARPVAGGGRPDHD